MRPNKTKAKRAIRVIISGGGTGGHVFPAIAIANALKEKDEKIKFLFVGAKGKIEMEKVPKAGYDIKGLWISGFQRKLTLRNMMFPFKLLHSLWRAHRIVKQFKPDVAVGVGGYASGPTLEMASRKGIPCLIQEQNSYAGITNRLLSKKAQKICVAYDNMDKIFQKNKMCYTGNPVRQDIWNSKVARSEAIRYFKFNDSKKTIMLMGGSLGAKTLNEAMRASHELLANRPDVQILWQAGKLYIEEFSKCQTAQLPNVQITAFIDRMDMAYAMTDIVIGRAGALTISELCLIGKPAILIPSPNVSEDHQTHNAMALVNKFAAVLVRDADAKTRMIPEVLRILEDQELQQNLSTNIKKLAKPNAAKDIAEEVLKLAKK